MHKEHVNEEICALEGGLIEAVLWSNQAYSILRPYLLHLLFNNNSGKSLEWVFSCVYRFQFRVFELSIYIATL